METPGRPRRDVTMSKVPIRPEKSDGTRVVVGVDGTAEEEQDASARARRRSSASRRLRRTSGIGNGSGWEGVQSGVLPFRRGDGALRELYAIDATPRAGAPPRV